MQLHTFTTKASPDYELLDSGEGMKLERYGKVVIARPDPQALWPKKLSEAKWAAADARFTKGDGRTDDAEEGERGKWIMTPGMPEKWNISYGEIQMAVKLTPFKHTGLFPEQLSNWQWSADIIREAMKGRTAENVPAVLNLFGYTGGASLSAVLAGAAVTHVDASRAAITWANENAEISGLTEKPIRWMLEDAALFVKREVRRGKKYDAIIMDPPSFGRGAKGEIWKIESDLLPLLDDCFKLLSDAPLFFIINGYAAGYSPIAYDNNLQVLKNRFGGLIESGELTIEESGPAKRLLPCGIVSRWKRS